MKKALPHQRFNAILQRLHDGETLSIAALAKEFHTTPKTISRDFKKLMEGDYGITRAEDGKQFIIKRHTPTTQSTLTTIKMLDSLSADIGGEFYIKAQMALQKLAKYFESPFYTRIDTEEISDKKLNIIEVLEEAIDNQQQINFEYKTCRKKKDKIRTFKYVHPYKILIFDGFFYLLAKAGDLTVKFYLREIRNIQLLNKHFKKEEKILNAMEKALNIWFNPDAEPFEVTLLLDPNAVVYFERKPIKGQLLKKNQDETAELTLAITDEREVLALMKKWLPQIKIIEPICLQEKFTTILKSYLLEE